MFLADIRALSRYVALRETHKGLRGDMRYRFYGLFALGLTALGSCESPGPDVTRFEDLPGAVSLAIGPQHDMFVIEADIGGDGPRPFLVDTGASISALFADTADDLLLTDNLELGEDVNVRGLIETTRRPVAHVDRLGLGEQSITDLRMVVLPRSKVDPDIAGILGMDVLQDYAFAFDAERRRITLIPKDNFTDGPWSHWDRVSLDQNPYAARDFGLHFGDGRLFDSEVPVLIDTGTTPSVANWEAASIRREVRLLRRELREQWRVEGASGSFAPKARIVAPTIELGAHEWTSPALLVLELGPLEILGAEEKPLVIAGADMLAVRTFVMNFAEDEMFIHPMVLHEPVDVPPEERRGAANPDDSF